ncbi:MAG: oligopeptide:H+ symporter [Sandaracinaceae bacterium]|nr:MAG: MFS transporter [Sandaracinaceae bacterium]
MTSAAANQPTLFGHPTGLFQLFFAEMWERFSYYGMRALLLFYMIKGFLGLNDGEAYGVYGAYTALVYMTPYFGGMLADRLLGRRRAVVVGGLLMAAGHLLMTIENRYAFFGALALLIAGNGFFKPNISTIVGELYPKTSDKKDAGFTIFYMGINLGAAMSPIICGYVGETYGWHYGFGLATAGMLIGVAVFVAPTLLTQVLIGVGVLATSLAMPFLQDSLLQLGVRLLLAIMLLIAGVVAIRALGKGPLAKEAGAPPDPEALKKKLFGFLPAEYAVYLGTGAAVIAFTFIVQDGSAAGWVLNITGVIFFIYVIYDMVTKCTRVERHRLMVVLTIFFFNMFFWACFEQAGTSLNNWTDRNIDRVSESAQVEAGQVGESIRFRVSPGTTDAALTALPLLSQEQLGKVNGDAGMGELIARAVGAVERHRNETRDPASQASEEDIAGLQARVRESDVLTMTGLTYLRAAAAADVALDGADVVEWRVVEENVGMGLGDSEIPASEFQAANPVYIIIFGLPLSALWAFLAARRRDPSTPVKFALGIAQLGLGFLVFYWGAEHANERGMSSMAYLLIGWLFVTTGELFSSPVGLSMVTKLSPGRLVSSIMGGWFLATAFSNYLAAVIATFTGVSHGEEGLQFIPSPMETAETYGDVFGIIGVTALGAAVVLLALAPLLKRGMHPGHEDTAQPTEF